MTAAGPRISQKQLIELDSRLEQIAAEFSTFATSTSPIRTNQGHPFRHGVGQPTDGVIGLNAATGWPRSEDTLRRSTEMQEYESNGRKKIRVQEEFSNTPAHVDAKPKIISKFDQIAKIYLQIWLTISGFILLFVFGLPHILTLF